MKPKQLLPGIALIAVLVALRLTSGTQGQPGPASVPPQREPMPMPGLAGTASCSARGCHGGILPRKGQLIEQDEYTLWLTQDKHAQAYEVLLGPRSQEIESKLGGKLPAHDDVRCLACHVTPAAANDSSFAAREERLSGVGCEACHGYARQWLSEHTTATWK